MLPSLPATIVVTPWLTTGSAARSSNRPRSWWLWVSMNPGVSVRPPASNTVSPGRGSSDPTATMRTLTIRVVAACVAGTTPASALAVQPAATINAIQKVTD